MRKRPDRTPGRCVDCTRLVVVNVDGSCESCVQGRRRQRARWGHADDVVLRTRDPLEPVPTVETMTRSLHRFLSRLPSHQPAA